MELLTVLMDLAPLLPVEPSLWAKFIAAVSAVAGGIVFGALNLIKKVFKDKKGGEKMKILLDIAPMPEDYITPGEIAGDMFLRALPFLIGAAIAVVAVALIMTVIKKK